MRRLFDDPQLPAALRQDLQRSRAAARDYPVSEKLLQLRAALSDGSRPALDDSSRPWQLGQLGQAGWKLLLIASLTGTGALAVQRWLNVAEPASAGVVSTVAELPPTAARDELPPVAAAAVEPPQALVDSSQVEARPAAATSERPQRIAASERRRVAPVPSSSSRKEIAQLVRIRELLKKDPAAALQLAQDSEQEFPSGLLSEERQALAILALAKTGSTDAARRQANALFLRYPQTPMRELIEAALAR